MQDRSTLLVVTHVVVRHGSSGAQIDDQTAAGLAQWRRHFDEVTYIGIAEDTTRITTNSLAWVDVGGRGPEVCVVALPRAYRVGQMVRHYRSVRLLLREAIARHRHLCFTIGGLVGDWPALAAIESIRQKRHYSAWIDRVEPTVIRNRLSNAPVSRRLAATVALPAMEAYTRHILRRSTVALLQGQDTFDHYASSATDPHCTYDTHTQASDEIGAEEMARKQRNILSGAALNIVYIGRADTMKGPDDWLDVLEQLHRNDVPFSATWMGDGPALPAMKRRVAGSRLEGFVQFPGFVSDREQILQSLRNSDLLLFCHKTAESARVLIEALVAGCALVGYGTAYSRGLVQQHGGGAFVPQNHTSMLVECVEQLHRNRPDLFDLITQAAVSGTLYNEDSVYRHRADLMRRA